MLHPENRQKQPFYLPFGKADGTASTVLSRVHSKVLQLHPRRLISAASSTFATLGLTYRDFCDFFLFFFLLSFSLKTAEHLKRTTFLASSCRGFSVCGFLPVRVFFSLTVNFPNPVIKRSSPDSRVLLMISMRESMMTMDSFFWRSEVLKIESARVALVPGMRVCTPWD